MITPVTGGTPFTVYATTPNVPARAPLAGNQASASTVQDSASTSPAAVGMILASNSAAMSQVHDPVRLTEPPFAALRAAIEQALQFRDEAVNPPSPANSGA